MTRLPAARPCAKMSLMRKLSAGLAACSTVLVPATAAACPCGAACHCWPTLAIVASFVLGLGVGALALWKARGRA